MKYFIYIISLLIVTSDLPAQFAEINFLTNSVLGNHVTADFDNDGDLDIACTGFNNALYDRRMAWFENVDGLGSEWEAHTIVLSDTITSGITAAGDLNGDGLPDLVLTGGYTLINNGDSPNLTFTAIENGLSSTYENHILGDLDGDGDLDIIRDQGGASTTLRRSMNINQDGTFGSHQNLSIGYQAINPQVQLGDLDQDNDLDIVLYSTNEEQGFQAIHIYENTNGLGSFSSPGNIVYSTQIFNFELAFGLTLNDFNNDDLVDIVFSSDVETSILFQDSLGNWQYEHIDNAQFSGGDLASADFDGDNDIDFINGSSTFPGQDVFLYQNNNGEFTKTTIEDSLKVPGGKIFVLGDFDNDGAEDISFHINASVSYNGVFLIKNSLQTTGSFENTVQVSDNINGDLVPFPIDLDGDADEDILFYAPDDRNIFWLENFITSEEFSEPIDLIVNELVSAMTMADLDNDGILDIIGINSSEELIWYKNNSTTAPDFGPKEVILTGIHPDFIKVSDFDNDGDLDIGAHRTSDQALFWYEQVDLLSFTPHLVSDQSGNLEIKGFGDFNNDDLTDILFKDKNGLQNTFGFFQQVGDGSFDPIVLIDEFVVDVKVTDFQNDSDDDIVILTSESGGPIALYSFVNSEGDLVPSFLANTAILARGIQLVDLDVDGKIDIYAGSSWHKQLNHPGDFSQEITLTDLPYGTGPVVLSDLNNDGKQEFIFTYLDDMLVWIENLIDQGSIISGSVRIDEDEDCQLVDGIDSIGLYERILTFERNGVTYSTSTNPNGNYAAFLPDSGDYLVNVVLPNNYWRSCVVDSIIQNVSPTNPEYLDFPIQLEFECPFMEVDIGTSNLRPCIEGSVNIAYCNQGTTIAENATVEILLDPFLNINSTTAPYTTTDSSLVFDIGNVSIFGCGNIQLSVTPDCDSIEVGDIVCSTVYVSPDSLCAPMDSLWDGSTIEVNGICINDSIRFELKNTGLGAMDEARLFKVGIVNDDIVLLILADTFQLASEEVKMITVDADMEVLRIEAEQDENHPITNTASTTVSECADFDISLNLIPDLDANPFSETICTEITGSYDPNIKEVIPIGSDEAQYIDRDWELDYTIHFQNTGNDTAFTVIVIDTLSEHLDLSTLKVGAASHNFTWALDIDRRLIFTFNNILLPDSTTNEPLSHGQVQFSIQPFDDTDFGTKIKNKAAIYFDFNDPIITNEVSQTIQTPLFVSSQHLDICAGEFTLGVLILTDTLLIDSTAVVEGLQLDFYHINAIPAVNTLVDTTLIINEVFNNVIITQDTILPFSFQSTNGCDSLVTYNITAILTNTKEQLKESTINVFPTPASAIVTIEWKASSINPKQLTLFNSNGQTLKSIPINTMESSEQTFNLRVDFIPPGVYWLKIDTDIGSVHKRVIKL